MRTEERVVVRRRWTVEEYHRMGEAVERYNDLREDGYRRMERARRYEEPASGASPGLLVPADDTLGR